MFDQFYLLLTTQKHIITIMRDIIIKHKGFTIEAELGDDPKVDITITKGNFWGSIGASEYEGLSDENGNTIKVPVSVIDRAYELEESLLG